MDYFNYSFYLLLIFAFLAGFIDSIVGGGGLIQLPAMFTFLPSLGVNATLGTNKMASFMGTLLATWRYLKLYPVLWLQVIPAVISSALFSFLGAMMVSYFNKDLIKPLILILLILVFAYTWWVKNLGLEQKQKSHTKNKTRYLAFIWGAIIGFYDGFFGPGTGSFLIMIYILVFGFDFLNASVSAKIINCTTNFFALIFFLVKGQILFQIAIPVGIANMTGAWFGAKMAIQKGSAFIRVLYLIIVSALILKFAYDLFLSS